MEEQIQHGPLNRRPATKTDLDFLVALRQTTMRAHFEHAGIIYQAGDQAQRVLYAFDCAEIITLGGTDIGLLKVNKAANPWHLIQIQLLPNFQRRGIGTQLIRGILTEAAQQGADVELTVLKASPAQKLYERLGFRRTQEHPHSLSMRFDAPNIST